MTTDRTLTTDQLDRLTGLVTTMTEFVERHQDRLTMFPSRAAANIVRDWRDRLRAALTPDTGLMGTWATHPIMGRVMIISRHPFDKDKIWVVYPSTTGGDGSSSAHPVFLEDLTLDLVPTDDTAPGGDGS